MRPSLDTYDDMPYEMKAYLRHNGWHFNKKACEYACSMMRKRGANGRKEKVQPMTKEEIDGILTRYGVELENKVGYDHVFVANMCKADFYGSSISDEAHMALYVKDVVDDVDAGDGTIMRRWYAGMVASGTPVDWEEIV